MRLQSLAFRWYDLDTHGLTPRQMKLAEAAALFLTRDPKTQKLAWDAEGARAAGLIEPEELCGHAPCPPCGWCIEHDCPMPTSHGATAKRLRTIIREKGLSE